MNRPPGPEVTRRIRGVLRDEGYGEESLLRLAGSAFPPPPHHEEAERLARSTEEPTRVNCITRWFYLGLPVSAAHAESAFPDGFVSICVELGLLRAEGDALVPRVLLVPCGDLLVASDPHQQRQTGSGFEHVLPINPPARHLLNFLIRRPSRATLDLCSGNALHALAAASFSDRVTAADVNPRAAEMARMGASLNEIENLECVTGDRFQPVSGRRFDLIACNPPFVLSPDSDFVFQDSGMLLDGFCRELVREVPSFLSENGFFQMILEWVRLSGEEPAARLGSWLEGSGCDAWILLANCQLPESYARQRIRATGPETGRDEKLARWLEYFRENDVEAIHGGFLTLRRRAGRNWVREEQLREEIGDEFGEVVLRRFEVRDLLDAPDADRRLLASRLDVSPHARLERKSAWDGERWQVDEVVVSLGGPLPVATGLDPLACEFFERFNGRTTLAAIIDDFAGARAGISDSFRPEGLRLARHLVEQGVLLAEDET